MHNIWVRAVGGALETRIRYSATLCYNTFPFPKISAEQKEELTALAREVLGVRAEHIEMTLGEMYNPETMPVDLRLAHQALDAAIERCYRPEPFLSDEERLEYLFKLYERMTKRSNNMEKKSFILSIVALAVSIITLAVIFSKLRPIVS